jgi:predicted nuclease of predicted toxin-antitoxin system
MRILFDHGTPRGLARYLPDHSVNEAKQQGWDTLTNGELLTAAEKAGFQVLLTTDRNIRYQQNLRGRNIAVVVLTKARWKLISAVIPQIVAAIEAAQPGAFTEVEVQENIED